MKRIISKFGLGLILAFCLTSIVNAEIMVGTSVEWLTCSADAVAMGMLKQTGEKKGVHSVIYESYTLNVLETIKGDKNQTELHFVVRVLSTNSSIKELANSGHPVIVFLSKYSDGGNETFLNNKLVPTNKSFPLSIINLDKPDKFVMDTKFNLLKKKENIIETSRNTLELMQNFSKKDVSAKIESRVLEVPFDSEAYTSLFSGSVCYLTVPNFMFPDAKKSIFDF